MPKIKKKKLKPHTLIVDTSILWHSDKNFVVHPDFDEFWENSKKKYNFNLFITDVVKGELKFQQTTSAINLKNSATEMMEKISAITGKKHSHRVTDAKIKEQVNDKFKRWLKIKRAKLLKTPVKAIDWDNIINSSIWRLPPFEFTRKDKDRDREKGFRDALILETVFNFCKQAKDNIDIAFLCKDYLLRETASSRLASYTFFSVYESIEDFKSYLRLTEEELEKEFLKSIHRLASGKFFTKGDATSLGIKENLTKKIVDDNKKYFENPTLSEKPQLGSLLSVSTSSSDWKETQSGTFWVGRSLFKERKNVNIYYWETTVTYIKLYKKDSIEPLKYGEISLPLTMSRGQIFCL